MSSKGAFKHSNRYAATASKYESVIERPVGPPRGPSKSSGKSGGNKPGPWDGVKPDAKSSGKRRERNEEKNSLLEKDYLAEAREKRERTSSIIGNVRARERHARAQTKALARQRMSPRLHKRDAARATFCKYLRVAPRALFLSLSLSRTHSHVF